MTTKARKPTSTNPYPGPRSFIEVEEKIFCGRENEVANLSSLIIARKVVLLYAASGAGKTSLLNAGIIPALRRQGMCVMPPARVKAIGHKNIDPDDSSNRFMGTVLGNWPESCRESLRTRDEWGDEGRAWWWPSKTPDPGTVETLTQFLKGVAWSRGTNLPVIPDVSAGESRPADSLAQWEEDPLVIAIDQFEELFTLYPDRWQDRRPFFTQLQDALDEIPNLHVLFPMRADYIAKIERYAGLIADGLKTRFLLERLDEKATVSAVRDPLKGTSRRFSKGGAEALAEKLVLLRVAGREPIKGEFAEPMQIQIVCRTLWDKLPEDLEVIRERDVNRYAPPEKALAEFYAENVAAVAAATGIPEEEIRKWFDEKLITEASTKGLVYRGEETTEGLANEAVDLLEDIRLIRPENRPGGTFYELTHDLFIDPIRQSNRAWVLTRFKEPEFVASRQLKDLELAKQMAYAPDKKERINAARELMLILSSRSASPSLKDEAQMLLSILSEDTDNQVRSEAAKMRYLAHLELGRDEAVYQRVSAARGKLFRKNLPSLAAMMIFGVASAWGIHALIAYLFRSFVDYDFDAVLVYHNVVLVVTGLLWGLLYTITAIDTAIYQKKDTDPAALFSLKGASTLVSAPFLPYLEGIDFYEILSGWPLNLLLPWGAAASFSWLWFEVIGIGGPISAIFYAVYVLVTWIMVWLFNEVNILW